MKTVKSREAVLEEVFDAVSRAVTPLPQEADAEKEFALKQISRLESVLGEDGTRIYFIGSAARDTGLAGDRDIDLFVAYPTRFERDYIVERTKRAIAAVLPGKWEMHYAEHPYFQAVIEGFKVEIIPCFHAVPNSPIKSAVDRSPLHMDYLQKRLSVGQKRDVRVLKLLLKRAGVYGAEASIGGFSGLLCEYLVLNYRSLYGLILASASWRPPVVVDIEAIYPNASPLEVSCRFSGAPLVVVDAIDATRNAAAAVSSYSLAVFSSLSSAILVSKNPAAFFEPHPFVQLLPSKAKLLLKKRGTSVELLQVPIPANLVEDVYHPQVRKAAESLASALQRAGFRLVGWNYRVVDGKALLLFESFDGMLPKLRVVQGPPVWFGAQVEKFVSAHARGVVRGPFIVGERVAVELLQDNVSLAEELSRLCSSEEISFGANLGPAFRRVSAADAFSGAGLELLSIYLSKKSFWFSSK